MAKFKIELDRDECIGCGSCAAICPDNWEVGEDGKASFKHEEIEDDEFETNKEAAETCAVNAIHIINLETGEKII
jgi:ferredoxin